MDPHAEAWKHLQPELLGSVCEVARRVPWGFYNELPHVVNKTCEQFLEDPGYHDTVLLHILLGEGESEAVVQKVVGKAYKSCLKLIVMEHSPESPDWSQTPSVSAARIRFLERLLDGFGERIRVEDWGRNRMYILTTVAPLCLDQISDAYVKQHIGRRWESSPQPWTRHGFYTHTSECTLPEEVCRSLPNGRVMIWVIGGFMFLEGIPRLPSLRHRLVDCMLKQVLYARLLLEEDPPNELRKKLASVAPVDEMLRIKEESPLFLGEHFWWQNLYRLHGHQELRSRIGRIEHVNLMDLHAVGQVFHTSTVPRASFSHLLEDNWVISSEGPPRDIPVLISKGR